MLSDHIRRWRRVPKHIGAEGTLDARRLQDTKTRRTGRTLYAIASKGSSASSRLQRRQRVSPLWKLVCLTVSLSTSSALYLGRDLFPHLLPSIILRAIV